MSAASGPNGSGGFHSRTDFITAAVVHEIRRWKKVLDADDQIMQTMIITVHLSSGGGHPRAVECNLKSEKRLQANDTGVMRLYDD